MLQERGKLQPKLPKIQPGPVLGRRKKGGVRAGRRGSREKTEFLKGVNYLKWVGDGL